MKNLHGMELSLCVLCSGDVGSPCWDGEVSGYGSCEACYKSGGPSERDCALAVVSTYLALVDATGKGPVFTVRGDLRITGKIVSVRTKKALRGLPVRLVFPNGLCLSTRTKSTGIFTIKVESYERRPVETIHLGTLLFRKSSGRSFDLGFTLNLRGAGAVGGAKH